MPEELQRPENPISVEEYLELLDLFYQVADSLDGVKTADTRWYDCQQLALKLFYHAATLYWLRQGTRAPLPSNNGRDAFFYDFASAAVVARSALETYLVLFEVFFEPKPDDVFEFRHALWLLSGFILREGYDPQDEALKDKFNAAQIEIEGYRERIRKTAFYQSMRSRDQRNILRGKRDRDWEAVLNASGFGKLTARMLYRYYSGFVHSDGLSGTQLWEAKTSSDQANHIESHMAVVAMVLSKAILDYADKFPEAKAVGKANPNAIFRAEVWWGVAKGMR